MQTNKRKESSIIEPLFGIPQQRASKYFEKRIYFCCIDIGITNLGLTVFSVDTQWCTPIVHAIYVVDITSLDKSTTEFQGNEISDRLERFFEVYKDVLSVEYIFIERQPICGHVAVEQLIFRNFRHISILVSPCTVQSYFRIGKKHGLDYDGRKEESIAITRRYLLAFSSESIQKTFESLEEKQQHVADAVCIGIYVVEQKRLEWNRFF